MEDVQCIDPPRLNYSVSCRDNGFQLAELYESWDRELYFLQLQRQHEERTLIEEINLFTDGG